MTSVSNLIGFCAVALGAAACGQPSGAYPPPDQAHKAQVLKDDAYALATEENAAFHGTLTLRDDVTCTLPPYAQVFPSAQDDDTQQFAIVHLFDAADDWVATGREPQAPTVVLSIRSESPVDGIVAISPYDGVGVNCPGIDTKSAAVFRGVKLTEESIRGLGVNDADAERQVDAAFATYAGAQQSVNDEAFVVTQADCQATPGLCP